MSAIGTKQTWALALHMSAFGGKRTSQIHATRPSLRRRSDTRPFVHLHAGDQLVAAIRRAEDRSLTLLHVEPVLAERLDNVRLVRDEYRIGVSRRCRASIFRNAWARRLFSFGDTMRPPSVMSAVFSISVKPARTAVS